MEKNIKNPVIIDFFGLPGCGKSTITRALAQKLVQHKFIIQDNIYRINNEYSATRRLAIKLFNTISFTAFNLPYIIKIISKLDMESFKRVHELVKQWINICFILTQLKWAKRSDIIIADQGIVQAAISLGYRSENIEIREIIRLLKSKVNYNILHIYVNVDVKTSLDRLNHRHGNRSRVENEKDEQLKKYRLSVIEKFCSDVSVDNQCIIIDNNISQDINKNSQYIKDLYIKIMKRIDA